MGKSDEPRSGHSKKHALGFWPFGTKLAMLFALTLFVLLLITWGAARKQLRLGEVPAGWALLGIAVLSLVPVILVILDGLASSGGSFEVASVKIALNAATTSQRPVVIPCNITDQPGLPVVDSGGSHILSTLRSSAGTIVVIVDLEDGHAWWETRLLVLCAGAQRLGRPSVIVFTAVQGGKAGHYLGWGSRTGSSTLPLPRVGRWRFGVIVVLALLVALVAWAGAEHLGPSGTRPLPWYRGVGH
ncbi:hypothetical protein ACIRYZ_24580 [Kitasatospora sp. NPDC101155]|uniref:hypothetical protein n=1 Tax=Kitasatospora sp. NPDC101155 TaxID=3364097 RepID=UPI0038293AED